eukprot:1137256-Pelagomonas_calceolata.AAC.3
MVPATGLEVNNALATCLHMTRLRHARRQRKHLEEGKARSTVQNSGGTRAGGRSLSPHANTVQQGRTVGKKRWQARPPPTCD